MRHQNKGRKLSRERDQRRAFLKILGSNFILKEKIITTEARAKELRGFIEKKITRAKRGDVAAVRQLRKFFPEKVTWKMIKEIAPSLKDRKGGYTRITKIGPRKNDAAEMVKIELIKK
ncbi:MAG: 50S ribosomal protein L17 [Patescibacteria group bacterium]